MLFFSQIFHVYFSVGSIDMGKDVENEDVGIVGELVTEGTDKHVVNGTKEELF